MRSNGCHALKPPWIRRASCALAPLVVFAAVASPGKRVHLAPHYAPGVAIRYRVESSTSTKGKTTTPIANPEGATQSMLTIHMLIRLDPLDGAPAAAGAVRFRASYEKSGANLQTDAFDPAQPSISEQYSHLQGHTIEFTLDPGGKLSGVKGLDEILPDHSAEQSMLALLSGLSPSTSFPVSGVEVGQKWKDEKAVEGAPLADLMLRSESTYLRDEPCPDAVAPAGQGRTPTGQCAVILTTFTISRRGSAHSEATPPDYSRNGLRVSGSWNGSGQSLDSISLSTGILIRSTQTSDQEIDYTITSTASGSSIRQESHVQSQSETVLEPAPPSSGSR